MLYPSTNCSRADSVATRDPPLAVECRVARTRSPRCERPTSTAFWWRGGPESSRRSSLETPRGRLGDSLQCSHRSSAATYRASRSTTAGSSAACLPRGQRPTETVASPEPSFNEKGGDDTGHQWRGRQRAPQCRHQNRDGCGSRQPASPGRPRALIHSRDAELPTPRRPSFKARQAVKQAGLLVSRSVHCRRLPAFGLAT